jgi:hypothetical protein
LNLICLLFGHMWANGYAGVGAESEQHVCNRCGKMKTHKFHRIQGKCLLVCEQCPAVRYPPHRFAETDRPCHVVCEICGVREERHAFVMKSECEKVCTKCGKTVSEHRWNALPPQKAQPGGRFWPTDGGEWVYGYQLTKDPEGCFCEKCLSMNPAGFHLGLFKWEMGPDGARYRVAECKFCGETVEKLTESEVLEEERLEEMRRYEWLVNEDEGIYT